MPLAFVNHRPAVAGQHPHLHGVSKVNLFRTGATVQRAGGAHEVPGCIGPRFPGNGFAAHAEAGLEVVGIEGALSAVAERKGRCLKGHGLPFPVDGESGNRQAPVHDGQRGMVLELTGRRPFHADEAVGEHGETGVSAHHIGLFVGNGILGVQRRAHKKRQQGGNIADAHSSRGDYRLYSTIRELSGATSVLSLTSQLSPVRTFRPTESPAVISLNRLQVTFWGLSELLINTKTTSSSL